MKVALCFSGQMRFLKETFPLFLENLINPNDITDIFIHSYWDPLLIGTPYSASCTSYTTELSCKQDPDLLDFISVNYKPLSALYEKQSDVMMTPDSYFANGSTTVPRNFQAMVYSIYKANELKSRYERENGFVYDAVIRSRFDAQVNSPIDISSLDLSVLNVANECNANQMGWCNDQFCITSSNNMDRYANICEVFKDYYDSGVTMHAETLFGHHLLNVCNFNTNTIENICLRR